MCASRARLTTSGTLASPISRRRRPIPHRETVVSTSNRIPWNGLVEMFAFLAIFSHWAKTLFQSDFRSCPSHRPIRHRDVVWHVAQTFVR
jgi:hypothetical protein